MSAPRSFTVPVQVLEVGGGLQPCVVLEPPPPLRPFRVPCSREVVVSLASFLYRWIEVTIEDGKIAAFHTSAAQGETP